MLDVPSLKPTATVKMRDINALHIEAQVVGKLLSDLEEQLKISQERVCPRICKHGSRKHKNSYENWKNKR